MALSGSDFFIVGRGATNYKVTGTALAAFVVTDGLPSQAGNAGYFLTTNGSTLSWAPVGGGGGGVTTVTGSSPILITGTAASPNVTITAATTGAPGSIQIATLAEAALGASATKALTPETGVPKDAAGMAGAALLPGSAAAFSGSNVTGMIRYNNSTPPAFLEYYNGSAWVSLATVSATQTFGLGLNVTGNLVKASVPIAATPPIAGAGSAQAIGGSLYWDDNLTQLFIRYPNTGGPGPVWVAAAPSASGGGSSVSAASLAEAAAGIINTKYLSPETGIAKNAAGTTGAALLPAGTSGQQPATAVTGMTRFNTTIGTLEVYNGTTWIALTSSGGNFDPAGWFGHSALPS